MKSTTFINWCIVFGLICLFRGNLSQSPSSNDGLDKDEPNPHMQDDYDFSFNSESNAEMDEDINEEEYDDEDNVEFEELENEDEHLMEKEDDYSFEELDSWEQDIDDSAPEQPPAATENRPRRISFDYSVNADSDPINTNTTDGGVNIMSGSLEDEDMSHWFVATSSGYEYSAKQSDLRSIFAAARLFSESDSEDEKSFSTADGSSYSPFLNTVGVADAARTKRRVFGRD